jgi:Mn2+/Fe2+ NRAMP family transporter
LKRLGLLTNAVQTLAGVLLPSATVILLLLCNDKAVLGPWANTRAMNLFTGVVIAALVMLSIILIARPPRKTGVASMATTSCRK